MLRNVAEVHALLVRARVATGSEHIHCEHRHVFNDGLHVFALFEVGDDVGGVGQQFDDHAKCSDSK